MAPSGLGVDDSMTTNDGHGAADEQYDDGHDEHHILRLATAPTAARIPHTGDQSLHSRGAAHRSAGGSTGPRQRRRCACKT